jgi:hypothetical protein
MRNTLTVIAFTLLVIGTAGLLLGEFAVDPGRAATLTFAVMNGVGLVLLGLRRWAGRRG